MSKYNLTDIFEQYQIGSGWTSDFDYDGMLKAGLQTGVDTNIDTLKKLFDDFEDVNYHREAAHLYNAIEAMEEGAIKEASMFFGDFHAEIKATMGGSFNSSDNEPTLGKFMASKMDENEAVDLAVEASQKKAGVKEVVLSNEILDFLEERGILKASDAQKVHKDLTAFLKEKGINESVNEGRGASYEKATSHIKEVRIEKEVASRIEGLMNIKLKAQFLDVFEDLWLDLIEEDPFYAEDVIAHLSNEMHKQISNRQAQGDRLAGMEESDTYVDEIGEGAMQPGEADLEAGVTGNMDAYTEEIDYKLDPYEDRDKIIKQVMSLLIKEKGASKEELKGFIKTHMEDILNAKDEDDIVDEFSQYLSVNEGDRALQEHFGRFMKDYQ